MYMYTCEFKIKSRQVKPAAYEPPDGRQRSIQLHCKVIEVSRSSGGSNTPGKTKPSACICTVYMYSVEFSTYWDKVRSSKVPDDSCTSAYAHVANDGNKPPGGRYSRRQVYNITSLFELFIHVHVHVWMVCQTSCAYSHAIKWELSFVPWHHPGSTHAHRKAWKQG